MFFKTCRLLSLLLMLTPVMMKGNRAADDALLFQGIERLLHEDFTAAEKLMDSLIKDYPDDPAPLFFKGMVYWRKSYNMDDYDDLDDLAMKFYKKAEDAANDLLDENDNDPYALFFKGGTLGYMGTLKIREESFFSAAKYAYSGIRNLQKAYEADSSFWDMYYGTGLYHVSAANASSIVKFVQKLLPIPEGDEKRGIRDLGVSIEKGKFSPVLAKSMLAFTYLYYKPNMDSAFYYIKPLVDSYPKSTDFLTLLINVYAYEALEHGETDWEKFDFYINKLKERMSARTEKLNDWYRQKILFYETYVRFSQEDYEEAKRLADLYVKEYDNDEKYSGVVYWILAEMEKRNGDLKKARDYYEDADDCDKIGNLKELLKMELEEDDNKNETIDGYRGYYFSLPAEP